MRIKELEDVLVLVDELPPDHQLRCAESLSKRVQEWEGQQADGIADYGEWIELEKNRVLAMVRRYSEQRKRPRKEP
jgi:hypothetical protein